MNKLGFCQVYASHIEHIIENASCCTSYKSSISLGFAKEIMPFLLLLCYNGSLVTWTVVSLTTAKFKPLIFSVWLRLVLYREHVHSHDFVWLLLVACIILLHNRTHAECLTAVCKSRTGVHLGKLPMAWRTFICRRCNFKRWVSAANSQSGQA
jgi:hypothetical protein